MENLEIQRINNTSDEEIKIALFYAIKLVGIDAKKLTKENMELMVNFLRNNFKTLHFKELKEAFEVGVTGALDVDLTHYQNFNALYVSKVLQAFKRYQQKNYKPPKRTELEYIPTKEDDETHFNFIANVFKETKQAPLIANWNAAYLHAEKLGLITLSNDEKGMFMENVIEELKEEKQRLKVQRLNWSSIEETLTTPALLKYECRKRILIKYFENEQ